MLKPAFSLFLPALFTTLLEIISFLPISDCWYSIILLEKDNCLPDDKILVLSKFKRSADDKRHVTQKLKLVLGRLKNMGKEGNPGNQHFLLFPQCFQRSSYTGLLKVLIV